MDRTTITANSNMVLPTCQETLKRNHMKVGRGRKSFLILLTNLVGWVLLSFTYAETAKRTYLATENKSKRNKPRQGHLASDPESYLL